MISLNEHRTALINLRTTIEAIDDLDTLIEFYSTPSPGPAYVEFYHVDGPGELKVQLNRAFAIQALQAQRQKLVEYMSTLGIDVDA